MQENHGGCKGLSVFPTFRKRGGAGPHPSFRRTPASVIPAQAGIQKNAAWTPAFAGVTIGTIPLAGPHPSFRRSPE